MIGTMGFVSLPPSYGNRREVDLGAQFIAPGGAGREGAMNRVPTLGQIIRAAT